MVYYKIRSLPPRKTLRYVDWFFFRDSIKVYGGVSLKDAINQAITYLPLPGRVESNIQLTIRDITKCFLQYGTTPRDYFLFGFDGSNKSDDARSSFVTDWDKDDTLIKYDGWDKYLELSDKYAFYKKAEAFYGRRLFLFDANTEKETAIQFIMKVQNLFIKPQGGSYGYGAFVAKCDNKKEANNLICELIDQGGTWILEERIIQDEGMAKWNSSSVNTIRFTSILTSKGYYCLTPVLRTGRKGSIVDNGGSGGILANVDLETGRIYTDGIDECCHEYKCHPDSGIPFNGSEVPYWEQLKETVEKAHKTIARNHKYIGWDLALSKEKWIVIEGNWGQFLNQYVDKKGRKEEFLKFIKS